MRLSTDLLLGLQKCWRFCRASWTDVVQDRFTVSSVCLGLAEA